MFLKPWTNAHNMACQYQITFHLSTNGPGVLQPVDNGEGEVINNRAAT